MSYIGQIRTTRYFVMHEEQRHELLSFKPFDTTQNMLYIRYLRFNYYHLVHTTADGLLVPPRVLPDQ
jgi:hypothetical protein